MSYDEAVMKRSNRDIREVYSTSLLGVSTGKGICNGALLAVGEGNVENRIKNVMKCAVCNRCTKKTKKWQDYHLVVYKKYCYTKSRWQNDENTWGIGGIICHNATKNSLCDKK